MIKVSIIIPVYNSEKYLPKCLDSVCNQTLKDIEIICVNDCSPDGSLAILQEYAKSDNRIKLINFTENKGASAARNAGIRTARGEYIGFVDSDDFVDWNFYEKLYTKAKETDADAVKGNVYDCDENGENPTLTDFYNMNDKIRKNKAYFYYGFTSAIYKTAFIRKYDINFPVGVSHFEDPYFSMKACFYYNKVEIVKDAKYFYTKRKDSACSLYTKEKGVESFLVGIKMIFDMMNKVQCSKEDYLIYFNFLMERIVPFCKSVHYTNIVTKKIINTMSYMIENAKVSVSDILTTYFLTQKENLILQNMKLLRMQKGKK